MHDEDEGAEADVDGANSRSRLVDIALSTHSRNVKMQNALSLNVNGSNPKKNRDHTFEFDDGIRSCQLHSIMMIA